jgi:alkylation response protein AidB-like acyl-CoA dehydrogenase
MEIGFTAEQEELANAVRSLAARVGLTGTREVGTSDTESIWARLCDLDLPGLRMPEGAGGSAALITDVMIVVEELSRHLVPVPYLGPTLGAELLRLAGAPASILAALASGKRRYTVVLDPRLKELGRIDDVDALAWDAASASGAVGLDGAGDVRIVALSEPLESADLTRTVCRVKTDRLTPEANFSQPLAPSALASWTAIALSLLTADLLGAMEATLDHAVTYSTQRVQFDQPIGSFQAIQHLCADAHVLVEGTRSGAWHAAWAADALDPQEALRAAQVAKAYAAEHAVTVAEAAIQVHGGIAMTWDTLPHLYLRRCLLSRQLLGNEDDLAAQLTPAGPDRAA